MAGGGGGVAAAELRYEEIDRGGEAVRVGGGESGEWRVKEKAVSVITEA